MKIGLLQIDGKLPNFALMQICAFEEMQGNQVEWFKGILFADEYDKIYASKIFKFSALPPLPKKTILSGTGVYDYENKKRNEPPTILVDPHICTLQEKLTPAMAQMSPSYTLYPDCNIHIGFSMKGCRMNCNFCGVPKKEGRPYKYAEIPNILTNPNGGNRLMLLDNDFFGIAEWRKNLVYIIENNIRVCFAQGINIRIITDEQAELLAQCNFQSADFTHKYVTFAWDRYHDGKLVFDGIDRCERAGLLPKQIQLFVLIGYDTTPEQDFERVSRLRDRGCMPYVMPYNKFDSYQKRFARWVNHRAIFNTVKWADYGKQKAKKFFRGGTIQPQMFN